MTESATTRLGTRIAINSAVQVAGVFVCSFISLFTFVAVTRYLGPTAYGHYAAALALLLIPSIVSDLGLSTTVLRDISRRPERTPRVVSASLTIRVLVALVAYSATLGIAWLAPFPHQTRMAALVACGGSLLLVVNTGLLPALQAELRMHWAVQADAAGRVLTLTLTLLALHEDFGLYAVIVAYVAGNALTLFINFLGVRRRVKLRPVLDLAYCWRLARSSILVGAALWAGTLYFRFDTVLLAAFRSADEVGLYAAAYKFYDLSILVVSAVSVSIFPHLTRVIASNDSVSALIQRAFDVFLALGVGLAVVAVIHAKHLVTLTSGSEFASSASALQILAPAITITFVGATFSLILLAAHRERLLLLVSLAAFVINIVLNVVLLPLYGYKAAAATTLACEVLWVLSAAWAVHRSLGLMPTGRFVLQVGVSAALMAAVLVFLPGPWPIAELVAGLAYVSGLVLLPGPGWSYVLTILPTGMRRQRSALT